MPHPPRLALCVLAMVGVSACLAAGPTAGGATPLPPAGVAAPGIGPAAPADPVTGPALGGAPSSLLASEPADPLAALPLYVDPESPARQALAADPASAPTTSVLAGTPQARWFTDTTPTNQVARAVAGYVDGAARARALPVLVIYAIPGRDCGGYTAGGLPDAAAYAAWVGEVAAGIGARPAAVVVEPDGLASADCLGAARPERFAMIKDAVGRLAALPATAVYLDAGHSRWRGPDDMGWRLVQAGVDRARGFSLNVSNFFTTDEETAYGEQLSAVLGAKHYVVDTSRNGRGPAPDGPLNWCNPPGRAIGPAPTTATGAPHADAELWIKNPGQSDGTCDRGDPPSGLWFPAYAADLVRLADPNR